MLVAKNLEDKIKISLHISSLSTHKLVSCQMKYIYNRDQTNFQKENKTGNKISMKTSKPWKIHLKPV